MQLTRYAAAGRARRTLHARLRRTGPTTCPHPSPSARAPLSPRPPPSLRAACRSDAARIVAGAGKLVIGREPSANVNLVIGIPTGARVTAAAARAPAALRARAAACHPRTAPLLAAVSSTHAMLDHLDDGSLYVTDLSSTNGTFVDGVELAPGQPVRLSAGAEVIFGDEKLCRFVLEQV